MSTTMNTEAIKELKRLADQCICHPVSRSIGEVEQAGEAIKSLIAQLEAAQAELAAIRALEPVAEVVWFEPDPYWKAQRTGKIVDASHAFFDGASIGTKLYALPEQK